MSGFEEYAALARRLHAHDRETERTETEATERREAARAALTHLEQRLSTQRRRLDELARAVGRPPVTGSLPTASGVDGADPFRELELARQRADEADAMMLRVETLAQQPPLLPGWSPLARALIVYAGSALAAVLVQFALVAAAGIGVLDTFSLYAWMCAGLPAAAFFAGYFVLSVWGRAPSQDAPQRYARLGFALCFIIMPAAYCGYLLLAALW